MSRLERPLPLLFLFVVGLTLTEAAVGEDRNRIEIEWPSPAFRDLQSAIDAAPNDAIIQIREGVYQIDGPLFVRGKRLTLAGAGSGRKPARHEAPLTHLVGPPPKPVVDDRGNLVLRAEAVEGLWNFLAADVVIQDMKLTGFDAGIVSKPDGEGNSGPTAVKDVVISDTGRGILSLSSDLSVEDCTISGAQWNGISFGGNPDLLSALVTKDTVIINPLGAGIYFEHALAFIEDKFVTGATTGGIVGLASSSFIFDSVLVGNTKAGILLVAGYTIIGNNFILDTKATTQSGIFGDGISLFAAFESNQQPLQAQLFNNFIEHSDRAGISVFGASVDFEDNAVVCASFDVFAAEYEGFDFLLNDLGGNQCGCPNPDSVCAPKGEGLEAPEPVGGLE